MSKPQATTQSPEDRRAAETALLALVAKFAPNHQKLVAAARRLLRKRLPTAHEIVYEYRSWFVISYSPNDKGYAGILAIRGDPDGVKLYFNSKGVKDPAKLLQGTAQARWIPLEHASTLTRPEVAELIEDVIARKHELFPRAGQGAIVVRSTTRKSIRRRRSA